MERPNDTAYDVYESQIGIRSRRSVLQVLAATGSAAAALGEAERSSASSSLPVRNGPPANDPVSGRETDIEPVGRWERRRR